MIIGTKVGPFTVQKELGSGAMGTVYLAKHNETGQRVAMKVVAPGLGSSKTAQARFQREADILKQLKHRNIVRLVGIGKLRGSPFYAMEFVEGESLDHVMARRKRLSWEETVELGQQLCAALQHAHENGIVHRDLKPSNLMLLPDGTLKLMDFGIAKDLDVTQITATNSTVGTAAYMSPEQCRGAKEITHKSDLYSLGVVLYEFVTGHKPFHAESVMEMFVKHTKATPERPSRRVFDIPIWLDTLIFQLLEKDPAKRPYDAATVGRALAEVREKAQTQESAAVSAARARKIDRTGTEPALDATDLDAARTLLGKKKKKKKEERLPIFQQKWFQALCGVAGLFIIACIFYRAFIWVPAPESLFADIEALKDTDYEAARKGPIPIFLSYYPDHKFTPLVQEYADRYDRDLLERQLFNRRERNIKTDDENEITARRAMDYEDGGKLDQAKQEWESMAKYRDMTGSKLRPYGLVAQSHLKQLTAVADLDEKLESPDMKAESKYEKLAVQAKRATLRSTAQQRWQELVDELKPKKDEIAERPYFLLAAKYVHDLGKSRESSD